MSALCLAAQMLTAQKRFAVFNLFFIGSAFLILLYAHVFNHFELLNVFLHSHTQKPLLYKIAGAWGSHEGSMLLWCVFLSFLNFCLFFLKIEPNTKRIACVLFGFLTLQFVAYLFLASNPFQTLAIFPKEGQDLNPVLQDISLAIHPPHLYLGALGYSLPFMLTLSSFLRGDFEKHTLLWVHRLSLAAFFFLTIGILLGAIWAYYELGWGGWWFFDPIENLALVPWLCGLVSLHFLMMEKRGSFQKHTAIASGAPFLLCLLSLALVRSGLLNSVHSFAEAQGKGVFLGLILGFWLLFFIGAFWKKNPIFAPSSPFGINRTTCLYGGMICVMLLGIALLFGTLFPVMTHFWGRSLTLSLAYFTDVFTLLSIPLLLFMLLAPKLSSHKDPAWFQKELYKLLSLALPITIVFHILFNDPLITVLGTFGVLLLISQGLSFMTFSRLPFSLSHGGFGLALIGIVLSSLLGTEEPLILSLKTPFTFEAAPGHSLSLTLKHVHPHQGQNYTAERALIEVSYKEQTILLTPEERFYWTQDARHMETSIKTLGFLHQIHGVLGDRFKDSASEAVCYGVKIIYKPYINLMWLGFFLMILGIGWSTYRRFRNL